MIALIDFGSQTTHLISRRINDLGIEVKIITPENAYDEIMNIKPKGIILSGGPSSVYSKGAPTIDEKIFSLDIPILGICYGLQLIAYFLKGKVVSGQKEFGPAKLKITKKDGIFTNLPEITDVWMSHGDEVVEIPRGFEITGSSGRVKFAAIENKKRNIYGIQFHPEVHHTPEGKTVLKNFVINICNEISKESPINIEQIIRKIDEDAHGVKTAVALSGGIDSTVAAVLASKALKNKLICYYVDCGLMREGETEEVETRINKYFKLNLKIIKANKVFLEKLKGVEEPEKKRNIIGNMFIRVFEQQALKDGVKNLIQGTIYPDVIESKGTKHASKIKTHHNVGGIPDKHFFNIIEPLRNFYKDEVREIAKKLNFPNEAINRHVFPGPGLAVRIIGEVTEEKLNILRKADKIVVEEIRKSGEYDKIWMAFAIFTGIKTTGVTGDERKYGDTIALRIIESKDTMTADWVRLPYEVLAKISNRIVNEVNGVVRVVYDITTKPPATMEWE